MNITQWGIVGSIGRAISRALGELRHFVKYGYGTSYGHAEQVEPQRINEFAWAQNFSPTSLVLVILTLFIICFLITLVLYKKPRTDNLD